MTTNKDLDAFTQAVQELGASSARYERALEAIADWTPRSTGERVLVLLAWQALGRELAEDDA